MTPMAFADEETTAETQTTQEEVAVQAAQGPFDVDVENPYSDITVKSAVLADGVLTIKVGYAAENQMAGIGYSYTLYDEDVTGRAIARQIDADGNVQADRANITGTVRDCTVYTMTVPEDAEDLKVTVDGLTTWTYDQESKTLTISGSGAMADFTYTTIDDKKDAVDEQGLMSFPWAQYKNEVQKVVVEDGITRLGIQSFRKFFALTELIVDSDDLTEIGDTLCMNDSALKIVDLEKAANLSAVGGGVFTGMTEGTNMTIKMAKAISGLWQVGGNYMREYTTFTYLDSADMFEENGWTCILIDDNSVELFDYTGQVTELTVPATITYNGKTYDVLSISGAGLAGNTKVTRLEFAADSKITTLPKGFALGSSAKRGGEVTVILPASLENIGYQALAMYSTSLTTLQVGSETGFIDLTGIKTIEEYGLSNLTTTNIYTQNVKFSDKLRALGSNAFRNDTFLCKLWT